MNQLFYIIQNLVPLHTSLRFSLLSSIWISSDHPLIGFTFHCPYAPPDTSSSSQNQQPECNNPASPVILTHPTHQANSSLVLTS